MEDTIGNPDEEVEDLLLGAAELNEQDPVGIEEETEEEDTFGDEEIVDMDVEGEESETVETDPFADESGMEVEDEFATEEGGEETVEVDVSDIVDKAEETRGEIDTLTSKMDELLGKFGELEGQVSGMDKVIDKIDGLEKEIEVRNPTPVEQLEMRSMDSFPYSVSLTDFWADKEGYDVGGTQDEEEYVITTRDVNDYSKTEIQQSFDYDSDDETEN